MGNTIAQVGIHNVARIKPTRKTLWRQDGTSFQVYALEAFDPEGRAIGWFDFHAAEDRCEIRVDAVEVIPAPAQSA